MGAKKLDNINPFLVRPDTGGLQGATLDSIPLDPERQFTQLANIKQGCNPSHLVALDQDSPAPIYLKVSLEMKEKLFRLAGVSGGAGA